MKETLFYTLNIGDYFTLNPDGDPHFCQRIAEVRVVNGMGEPDWRNSKYTDNDEMFRCGLCDFVYVEENIWEP